MFHFPYHTKMKLKLSLESLFWLYLQKSAMMSSALWLREHAGNQPRTIVQHQKKKGGDLAILIQWCPMFYLMPHLY
jgi:hypothetical protein